MSEEKNERPVEEESDGLLDTAVDASTDLADALGGLPPQVKKGIWKTLKRFGTATLDLGVAKIAGRTAEIQAITKARTIITEATAAEIAEKAQVPQSYVDAAVLKNYEKIVGRKITMDTIVLDAAKITAEKVKTLSDSSSTPVNEKDTKAKPVIDDEFLNEFERQAETKTSEEIKAMFSGLLSHEIIEPGSISTKTIKTLGDLTPEIALLFQKLCSITTAPAIPKGIHAVIDVRAISMAKSAGQNGLKEYGLNYSDLCRLSDYGLVATDFSSHMTYEFAVVKDKPASLGLKHQNKLWILKQLDHSKAANVKLNGVALSTVGRELLPIVDLIPNDKYIADLNIFLKDRNVEMLLIGDPL